MPICFIRPSSITLCRGPPESPLQVLLPPAPEMQMLFLLIWKSSKTQAKLVMVLVVTSRNTGEMLVAESVGFPHPLAGA